MIQTNSDGGSRGNPGPAAIGVIVRKNNKILEEFAEKIGEATNNVAEYKALIKALELAKKHTKDELTCYLDSELIVKQLNREYRVKNPRLKILNNRVQRLKDNFKEIKFRHVSRWNKFQKIADKLLNEKLDESDI